MNFDTQFALALLTACQLQQNQMLRQQNAMLCELIDHVDSVGDRIWRMERDILTSQLNQTKTSRRTAKKRGSKALGR